MTKPTAEPKPSFAPYVRLGRPRPSQIMRRMDRVMHRRWLEKIRPQKPARENGAGTQHGIPRDR